MHVGGITVDLNWLLQFIFAVFLIGLGLLYLVKNTASKYFEVDANFEGGGQSAAADTNNNNNNCFIDRHQYSRRQSSSRSCHTLAMAADMDAMSNDSSSSSSCPICGNSANKKCSRCKSVRYCSQRCQETDWNSGHKSKCKGLKVNSTQSTRTNFGFKASGNGGRGFSAISLVPASGTSKFKPFKMPGKVLFPYNEFIKLYHSNKPAFPPCGLLNCGNSCFANVVLQCLTYTRPLVAYLLDKGHQTECRRNDWCFLCVFQSHIERSSQSSHPFSPMNILSRLPNIGGNLGYGRQEDAHEFMRFAIDTMQSVCLDEFGGEKAVDPATQETTIIQHIFGGQLQSQVICTKCNKISNQFENMMDLTVEIHGDAASLEECLDQFTAKEALHGDNMYKCDGCNGYVKAWKRLTIRRAPNILTIALKRFQSGRFGKLNKRVTFPETLDLSPYMSEEADGTDVYKLYAVVVHVDMLNASFFGHYICYIKDFHGDWHRIDDCKVSRVDLEEVLSQGAYMLLYSRVSVRQSCLRTIEPPKKQQSVVKVEFDSCLKEQGDCPSATESMDTTRTSGSLTPGNKNSEVGAECCEDVVVNFEPSSAFSNGVSSCENESSRADLEDPKVLEDNSTSELCLSAMEEDYRDTSVAMNSRVVDEDPEPMAVADSGSNPWACSLENGSSASEAVLMEYSDHADGVMSESSSAEAKEAKVNGSIYSCASEEISTKNGGFKCELSFPGADSDNGNGAKRAEIINGY